MKKFLVLYHAPVSAREQMASATPEHAKAGMDAWMNWAKKAGSAVVDLGMPLGDGRSLKGTAADATVVGFSILQAESMQAITKVLEDHPHLRMPQFSIKIFESFPMLGM